MNNENIEIELIEKKDNMLKVSEWNGDFSSGSSIVTYENGNKDGKEVMYYTKNTPASPFNPGSQDETINHTIDLATGSIL